MAEFLNLLSPGEEPVRTSKKASSSSTRPKRTTLRGCGVCPRNGVSGIHKILGTVSGKDIFVWAQSPGVDENAARKELVGRSGQWLWRQLEQVGIRRADCDIQNVMRCLPADREDGRWVLRDPTKEELRCCSQHTDVAVAKSAAKIHLVFGRFAADCLLGKKRPKGQLSFWSTRLNAQVYLLDHPAYFIRGASGKPEKLAQFRATLSAAATYLDNPSGQFGHIKNQDYRVVHTATHAKLVADLIRRSAKAGERIAVDLEDGTLEDGRRVALVIGFSNRPGRSRVFVLDHPEAKGTKEDRAVVKKVVCDLLADESIEKVCHHGDYDDIGCQLLLKQPIVNYRFDTNYSEYLAFPGEWSYKLAAIADRRFPQFSGYKELIMPEAAPAGMTYDQAYAAGKLSFGRIPLDKLVMYNAVDCDLTKRIETTTKSRVYGPLLRVYVDAAYTISRMESNGPLFDSKQAAALAKIYPARVARALEKLQAAARDPEFNPGSPEQVYNLLYKRLRLERPGDSDDTRKETLEILSEVHPVPRMILDYRADSKVLSTYVAGFQRSAEMHGGRVRTIWWQTGTTTGRLSSGGGKEKAKNNGIVNLQNIHHDVQVKNMLVSDARWRDVYRAWKRDSGVDFVKEFGDFHVFLSYDFAQMEIRFLAQSSGDKALIRACTSGDIHSTVGHEITGWPIEKIKSDDQVRKLVKNLHFGLIYGLQGPGMVRFLEAKGVKTTLSRVNELLAGYFRRYPGVRRFIRAQHEFCERHGYVQNLFGFRIPIGVTEDSYGQSYWKNKAVNYPIQGGAHQMLTMALALMHRYRSRYAVLGPAPHMEVHDALVLGVRLRDLAEAYTVGKALLEKDVLRLVRDEFSIDWRVPLSAEGKMGFRFGVAVPIIGVDTNAACAMWCSKNREVQRALRKEIAVVESSSGNAAPVSV